MHLAKHSELNPKERDERKKEGDMKVESVGEWDGDRHWLPLQLKP